MISGWYFTETAARLTTAGESEPAWRMTSGARRDARSQRRRTVASSLAAVRDGLT